jgi:CHAD domain-containing protein
VIEIEDKFRVHPEFEVPDLADPHGPVGIVSAPRHLTLTAVYHDTCDLRLAREGITLRHRSGGDDDGWHLKLPVPGAGGGVREEILEEGSPDVLPPRLRGLVTAYLRGEPLQPQATLRTRRTTRDLLAADGALLAELVDDQVDALTHDHRAARFREIEVEDRGGGSVALDHVGAALREAGAVAGEFQPKVVRALGTQATAAPDPPAPVRPGPRDPVRALIAATLRRHVRQLIEHDVGVRLGTPDALHQMRVSARRVRSALRSFGGLLDEQWSRQLADELRWLGQTLSAGRENEVVAERLRDAFDQLGPEVVMDRAEARLMAMLEDDAAAAGGPVEAMLSGERYVVLLAALVDGAAHPRTMDAADSPCEEVLPAVLRTSWRRLAQRASRARRPGSPPEALHKARIAAKNTRYLADALVDVYGKPARRLERRLKEVQDVLGEHQDAVNACARLRRAALTPRVGRAAFTYGALFALQEQAAELAREQFGALWPTVKPPKLGR